MRNRCSNKKTFSFILIYVTLFICFFNLPLYSDKDNEDTIILLGNRSIPPIIYEENGIVKGIFVDIAKAIGETIGLKYEIKAMDWEEAQSKVLAGEAHALLHINSNPERKKLYDFSDSILKSEFSIFKKQGNNVINKTADLKGKDVGVEKGGYPYHLLKDYYGINLVIIPNWNKGFEMVESGEIDVVVVDKWIGEYELAKSKINCIAALEDPIEIQYSKIAVKKGNEELLALIDGGLKQIKSDGTMEDILKKWQGENIVYYTEKGIRNTFLYIVIFVLSLVLFFSLYLIYNVIKLNKNLEINVIKRTKELNEANEKLRVANEELEKISVIDSLTNIPNRRCFDSTLKKEWGISMRDKLSLALIMIDIDRFKKFNDTYGHLAGVECLKLVANTIKNTIKRPGDFVARFGGEEFVVLLYNTNEDGAAIIAEEIRWKIESLAIKNEGIDSILTISLGVAAMTPGKGNLPIDLIDAADKAMYKAKELGRNKVVKASTI